MMGNELGGRGEQAQDLDLVEQASVLIDDAKDEIAGQLGLEGGELEQAVDEYIVDRVKFDVTGAKRDGVVTSEEQTAIDGAIGGAVIRTLDEIADNKMVATPVDQLTQDGFGADVARSVAKFEDQHHRGFNVRESINRIIEAHDKRRGDKMAERATRMVDNGDVYKFQRQVHRGKMDIGDERIVSTYLRTIGGKEGVSDYQISSLVSEGVPLERIASDERIAGIAVDGLVKTMSDQLAKASGEETDGFSVSSADLTYNFPIKNESGQLLELLMQNPDYRQKIAESVDIQAYGALALKGSEHYINDRRFLDDDEESVKRRETISHHIELLKQLGYEPFQSDEELQTLFNGYHPVTKQENLSALGLIESSTVDRMYRYKWEQMKAWTKEGGKGDVPKLSVDLEPSEENEMANYWRRQSEGLGQDAMGFVLERLVKGTWAAAKEHDIFGEYSDDEILGLEQSGWGGKMGESIKRSFGHLEDSKVAELMAKYIQRERDEWVLFDEDGLPKPTLFADRHGLLMHDAKYYNWEGSAKKRGLYDNDYVYDYDETVMRFLAMNVDMISGEDKGFVSEWVALDNEEARKLFMLYATDGHNIQDHLFDENGRTEKFYRHALYSRTGREALPKIDEQWQDHFSASELSFIVFDSKYERAMQSLSSYDYSKDGELIEHYFDEDGPTKALAEDMYKEKIVSLADMPELVALCSPTQQKYLEFLKQSKFKPFLLDIKGGGLDEYFDENGAKPELWQLSFSKGEFDLIFEQNKDMRDRMQLDVKQEKALKVYQSIGEGSFDVFKIDSMSEAEQEAFRYVLDTKGVSYANGLMNKPLALRNIEKPDTFDVNEDNILECLSAFINLDANDWTSNNFPGAIKDKIKTAFADTQTKNLAMNKLQNHWQRYIESGESQGFPMILEMLASHCSTNEGAGPLTQIESFLDFMGAYRPHAEKLYVGTRNIEGRLTREKWGNSEVSDFYNVSAEVISASPEVYSDFMEFFNDIPTREDFKKFVSEVYPLYRAQLILQKDYDYDGDGVGHGRTTANYSKLDKEKARTDLRNTLLVFNLQELSPEQRKIGVERVKEIILDGIKDKATEKFGILETAIPEQFDASDMRSLENLCLYYSNIANRTDAKNDLIGFYLALLLDKQNGQTSWDRLRAGEQIDAAEYVVPTKAVAINAAIERSREGAIVTSENVGLPSEQMPSFLAALQQNIESIRIGSIQTIDMKLGNLIGNMNELRDPDYYVDELDKKRITILDQFSPKQIGAVSAKLFQSLSGREQTFDDEELRARDTLEKFLRGQGIELTPQNIKTHLQDGFKTLSTVFNISHQVESSGAIEEIGRLQEILTPTSEVIDIFNRLGEDFSTQSGAMALSSDLNFLENLIVKKEDIITSEEKGVLTEYLSSIRDQVLKLEDIYGRITNNFSKIKGSNMRESNPELSNKIAEIDGIVNGTIEQCVITTSCSNQFNTIIENMRACLSAKTKGINNDTDLTFAEPYKFYLYSHNETDVSGSISDEIVYFVPTETANGETQLSFVMDQLYGQKTSDVFYGHIDTLVKKLSMLKRQYPDANMSILVTKSAISSASVNGEMIKRQIGSSKPNLELTDVEGIKVSVPASAFGDHYVEFGGVARDAGERAVDGIRIELK